MSESLIQVSWCETEQMRELFVATWTNQEPGFQVEDVIRVEELHLVFNAMDAARPKNIPKRGINNAYSTQGVRFDVSAHTDTDAYRGLAIHQNLGQKVPVELGVSKIGQCANNEDKVIDSRNAHSIRSGHTRPGTLTVFSEGEWRNKLEPTIHLFDRDEAEGAGLLNNWVRYAHMVPMARLLRLHGDGRMSVKKAAEYAFKFAGQFETVE